TVIEPACSASSSLSSVAVSGATNNILQVRFKHSPPPNTSSVVLPEIQESKIQSTPTPNNLPTNPCPVSDIPKSIVSEDPKFHTVLHAGKSYRSSESNSLLHHLVSTLKQCHQVDSTTTTTPTATTVTTTITTTTDVYHFNNNNNNTDFIKKSNFPSTSLELSSPAAATTTTNLCLATDLEDVKQSKSLNSLESNEKHNHHNNKTSKTGILWAVDPIDGCEWILHNRPPRPSIIPKYASSNSRLGGAYRSKTTHFLNLSEVSVKSPSKRANTYESSRRAGSYSTRRRRRSLITGSRMDSVNQKKGSKDSESLDGLNDSEESNAAKRLVQDILALRSEQKESGFLRFPLTETSMLNTSGWRAFRCLDNLDLLAYTELQTLQTVENIGTDLERQLDCINSEAAPLFSRNSWFYSVPTDSVNIAGGSQSLAAKKLSLAIQLNRAMEYVRGISQRKRCMLDSLQRMSSVTKNLITHFSLSINQIIEELERSANNSSKSLSPSSSSKTNLDSNTVSNSLNLRRSCRKHSPNNTSTNVRQVRRRGTAAGSSTSSSKHSASLIKNSSNTCPGTSSQGPICNGESSNYSILRNSHSLLSHNMIFLVKVEADGRSLTSSQELESLRATLTEINTCLSIENDKLKYSELFNLKKDLEELITLKEDELLAYRKLQLLTEVDSILAKNNTTKNNEIEPSSSQINTLSEPINEHSLIGQRCSIPGWTSNGKFIRQNALILSIVDCDGEMPERVRVILSHPTRYSEIPCESFFETGSCYRGIRCPNSHGKIVNIECIHVLDDDDDDEEEENTDCDVSTDGSSSKLRSHVQFFYGTTLNPSELLMDSSSSVISVEEESKINNDDDNNKQHLLGEWEVHTRGIGSRLLASMGYPGYGGLGRCHQGRQFPVCTSLEKYQIHSAKWHRPSLDNVVLPPKRRKARRNAASLSMTQGKKGNVNTCRNTTSKNEGSSYSGGSVFQLINLALLSNNRSGTCSTTSTSDNSKPSNVSNSLKNTQISSITHCNESVLKRKLFHTHEQINKLHQHICKAQGAVKRNEGRDRIAVKQAQQRVVELQSQLIQLKENERTIVNMQNKQMKEKKLRIF
ncbi:unnamed protein product, partial [Trichobilharzia regenti]